VIYYPEIIYINVYSSYNNIVELATLFV
jgi:hypothetical protein